MWRWLRRAAPPPDSLSVGHHLSDSRASSGHGVSSLTVEAVIAFMLGTWNLLEESGKEKGNLLRVW